MTVQTEPRLRLFSLALTDDPLRGALSHPLEYRGDAHPAADAERHEPVAGLTALQLVQGLDGEHRARGSDGMAQRDRSADGVHLLVGYLELPLHREGDGGVRLVRLDDVDVIDGQPRLLERLERRGHHAD